jgi:predicted RNA polymerase sigma factor
VLYLIFNEGYSTTAGPHLHRADLCAEAIRLARMVHRTLPAAGAVEPDNAALDAGEAEEVAGLLALMLLTDARRPARTAPDGSQIPMAEQDRTRWNADNIAEGVELITEALPRGTTGPYQLQAAIAAVHDEAPDGDATDWREILGLYGLLATIAPSPMVTLNRIVAVAMVEGPAVALAQLDAPAAEPGLAGHHRVAAVRAHLLEMAGDDAGAAAQYRIAARRTLSVPERRYLLGRAERLPVSPGS